MISIPPTAAHHYPLIPREDLCGEVTRCILARGHEGPCVVVDGEPPPTSDFGPKAAVSTIRRASMRDDTADRPMNAGEHVSESICTEWYDGPLRSIALVTCDDGSKLVCVETNLAFVGEPCTIGRDHNARDVRVRFTRDELVDMLALIDGRPVVDFHGKVHVPEGEHA